MYVSSRIISLFRKFFERIILCNSLVWTCSETGKSGLTYQEALDSEKKIHRQISDFPVPLMKPVLYLAHHTERTSIYDMSDDVYQFTKDRYFVHENVEVLSDGYKYGMFYIQFFSGVN